MESESQYNLKNFELVNPKNAIKTWKILGVWHQKILLEINSGSTCYFITSFIHILLWESLKPAGEEVASKLDLGGRWRKLYGNGKLKDPNNGGISEEIYEHVKLDYSEQ